MIKTYPIFLLFFLTLFLSPVLAGNVLYEASLKSFDKKLVQFDKSLKQERYGNKRWEKKLSDKKKRLVKDVKKIEKKWPNEDVTFLWDKLEKHTKKFDSKLQLSSSAKPKVTIKQLKPNNTQDLLYQSALKSLKGKFERFEKLLAKEDYSRNSWISSVDRDKNKLTKSIKKLEKNWPKKDTKPQWTKLGNLEKQFNSKNSLAQQQAKNKPVKNNKAALHKNNIKIIKAKFERLDSYMKQEGYGERTWDKNLKNHASSLMKSIKVIEKDLPQEAKVYWGDFKKRVDEIKVKDKLARDKASMLSMKKKVDDKGRVKSNKQKISSRLPVKDKVVTNQVLLQKVTSDQQAYSSGGKIEIWDNSTGDIKRSTGDSAYLSFSSDYAKADENKVSFSGKEYIYAHLHLPKKLKDMLPAESAKGLQYYRVTIIATVKSDSKYNSDKTQKNGNKLQRVADFKLGYDTKTLSIAVVPERGFFESVLDKYRSADNFSDNKAKEKALRDLLSRNFSRQISLLFKKLPVGSHQVEMEFRVIAKLRQEKFYELKNMKGTFLLNVDQEAKERYKNTFDMLTKLYRSYESEHNIAVGSLDLDAEKKKLAAMSPMKRECYHIAKRSPEGYMACYKGAKSEISFHISPLRGKAAFIDITWPKGSCERCMAGSEGGMKVRKNAVKKLNIPNGARVSINGRTLINSVSSKEDVILHWYF
ncbi:MAG: hypothetical protein QM504_03010 [Pseudomonadota bacterium]